MGKPIEAIQPGMDMNALILVINCGSSSIKFSLADSAGEQHILSGLAENLGEGAVLSWKGSAKGRRAIGDADHRAALLEMVHLLHELGFTCSGIGHRVVHGGEHFSGSCLVDEESMEALRAHQHLAPLHNPVNILGIEAAREAFPGIPQVMVFDTSFHQSMPKRAYLYAIPYALYEEHRIRRYGFHGTSHRYVAAEAARLLGTPQEDLCLVTAHLGNGCSAAAVRNGVSVDTTMGLTPLEGLVMGTRSGDVDPSLHQYMCDTLGMTLAEVTSLLNKKSGLLGLSGSSNDMRQLLESAETGDRQAELAVEVFCYRLAKSIAGLVVGLGHLDALVFTGGIGENSFPVRKRVLHHLEFLGLKEDPDLNASHGRDHSGRITSTTAPAAMVVNTDEEMVIARDTAALLPDVS